MDQPRAAPPRFSILLPTHNRADVLDFAIRSVLAQTEHDFELLVVGDGCTDRTAEVVAAFADPRIRWFDLPKGPHFGYANRNLALRDARGDLIAYMAHDDLWLSDHLTLLGAALAAPGIEFAYSRPLWVAPDGVITPSAFPLYDDATRARFINKEQNSIPSSCVAHRRACLERYGYWDESLVRNGDWDLWSRIIVGGGGHNLAYEPTPTCLHFRAIWKTEATAGPYEIHVWRLLRERGKLPATLPLIPIVAGQSEQASAWRSLAADPVGQAHALREGVTLTLDLCAAQVEALIVAEDTRQHAENLAAIIAQHERALTLKEQHVVNLEGALASRDRHIGGLDRALTDKDRHIANLEGALVERDRHAAGLAATLAARDEDQHARAEESAVLERALVTARHDAATHLRAAQESAAHATTLAAILADKERHIARIEGRLPFRAYRRLRRLLP